MAQQLGIFQVAWLPSGLGGTFATPGQIGRFIPRIQGPIVPLQLSHSGPMGAVLCR